jgi:hypothetical protein
MRGTMNKHLKLVREFHDAFLFPQAVYGANVRLSEMDIILCQALLRQAVSYLRRLRRGSDKFEDDISVLALEMSAGA